MLFLGNPPSNSDLVGLSSFLGTLYFKRTIQEILRYGQVCRPHPHPLLHEFRQEAAHTFSVFTSHNVQQSSFSEQLSL